MRQVAVVRLARYRIAQHQVRPFYGREPGRTVGVVRILIRPIELAKTEAGILDFVLGGVGPYANHVVK